MNISKFIRQTKREFLRAKHNPDALDKMERENNLLLKKQRMERQEEMDRAQGIDRRPVQQQPQERPRNRLLRMGQGLAEHINKNKETEVERKKKKPMQGNETMTGNTGWQ